MSDVATERVARFRRNEIDLREFMQKAERLARRVAEALCFDSGVGLVCQNAPSSDH
jgi:hypothetical protein